MPPDQGLDSARLTAASPWDLPVEVAAETASTNGDLIGRGEAGAPEGTILFAERQTAGRGQFGRAWNSAAGLGLWFSLLLRPAINDATVPLLSAFPAVALARTLGTLGIGGGIKAPNDLLVGGRKVAGILVETRTGKDPFAVVGIGLNVNHGPGDFPEELEGRAASLAMVAGSPCDRNTVAEVLLGELGAAIRLMRESPEDLLAAWKRHLLPKQDCET